MWIGSRIMSSHYADLLKCIAVYTFEGNEIDLFLVEKWIREKNGSCTWYFHIWCASSDVVAPFLLTQQRKYIFAHTKSKAFHFAREKNAYSHMSHAQKWITYIVEVIKPKTMYLKLCTITAKNERNHRSACEHIDSCA